MGLPYKHIFFDLDHTLWDFDRNSREVLEQLYVRFDVGYLGNVDMETYLRTFKEVNRWLWTEYDHSRIGRDEIRERRFDMILSRFGVSDKALSSQMSEVYLFECPQQPHLLPHAKEVLEQLRERYVLHIITNGFKDVQHIKLKSSGIDHYFDQVVTSECTGHKKPDVRIFEYALGKANAQLQHSLMVGDNPEVDIHGASQIGMDAVFYNPFEGYTKIKAKYEVASLKDLLSFL